MLGLSPGVLPGVQSEPQRICTIGRRQRTHIPEHLSLLRDQFYALSVFSASSRALTVDILGASISHTQHMVF